jgi:hypothetical protein
MVNVFNTPFEISLRVLLTLSVYDKQAMTADLITAADFITVNGRAFGVADENLNGDNAFNFSEFALRRELVQKALKILVLNGLATVYKRCDGFRYGISNSGEAYRARLDNDYADEYFASARSAKEFIGSKSEREVLALINRLSAVSLQRGGRNG